MFKVPPILPRGPMDPPASLAHDPPEWQDSTNSKIVNAVIKVLQACTSPAVTLSSRIFPSRTCRPAIGHLTYLYRSRASAPHAPSRPWPYAFKAVRSRIEIPGVP